MPMKRRPTRRVSRSLATFARRQRSKDAMGSEYIQDSGVAMSRGMTPGGERHAGNVRRSPTYRHRVL